MILLKKILATRILKENNISTNLLEKLSHGDNESDYESYVDFVIKYGNLKYEQQNQENKKQEEKEDEFLKELTDEDFMWEIKDDFKIGDKVYVDANNLKLYGIIECIDIDETDRYIIGSYYFNDNDIRPCTPEEIEKYFN